MFYSVVRKGTFAWRTEENKKDHAKQRKNLGGGALRMFQQLQGSQGKKAEHQGKAQKWQRMKSESGRRR